jgi:hypothetical protein
MKMNLKQASVMTVSVQERLKTQPTLFYSHGTRKR